ncbi:MAG: hypothetical protein HYR51_01240 [Candidatus Rokubacteria bacterium]|nr:hypothetical protein [Candidatus Rokubacteria bacterium]
MLPLTHVDSKLRLALFVLLALGATLFENAEAGGRRLAPVSPSELEALKTQAARDTSPEVSGATAALPGPSAAMVTTAFNGLNRVSGGSLGFIFAPPDTIVAKSPNRVLEAVNSALRLFSPTGTVLDTKTLNSFFPVPDLSVANEGLLFDPKVYFDRNAANKRFYVIALEKRIATEVSKIWLAVSRSADPTSLAASKWCRYKISGKRNGGTANSSWADYPGLGAGANALVITANQFRFTGDEGFTFAIIRVLNKLTLANNATSCPALPAVKVFQPASATGDGNHFTIQPVQHYSGPSSFTGVSQPAYALATVFGTSTMYRVYRISNVSSTPKLHQDTVAGSFTYGIQPDAPQSDTASTIDTGDNRMTHAAGVGNFVTGVHGTLCNFGGGATESCARVVRIQVSGPTLNATMSKQHVLGGTDQFHFWPGVAVNSTHDTAVVMQSIGATLTNGRLSARWTTRDSAAANFSTTKGLTTGTCPQTFTNRSGDYTGAQTDPSDFSSFWLAGERATTLPGRVLCEWQTRIIKITAP